MYVYVQYKHSFTCTVHLPTILVLHSPVAILMLTYSYTPNPHPFLLNSPASDSVLVLASNPAVLSLNQLLSWIPQ